jgi:M6 family metalloprotease-like protein
MSICRGVGRWGFLWLCCFSILANAEENSAFSPMPETSSSESAETDPAFRIASKSKPLPQCYVKHTWWAPKKVRLVTILWDPQRMYHPAPEVKAVEAALFGSADQPNANVADYFRCQSAGAVQFENTAMLGWFKAKKPAEHYWRHPVDARDGFKSGHTEKWTEAIDAAAEVYDFAALDLNHDRVLDPSEAGVLIVIPQNDPFGTNRAPARRETPDWKPLMIQGVKVPIVAEAYLGQPINFPVMAHELGHLFFGLPDMYINEAFPLEFAGAYSLMDVTYQDAQIDALGKFANGWVKARDALESGSYSLKAIDKLNEVLRINRTDTKNGEFFLFENRQRGRYDSQIPDTGIAIWNGAKRGIPGRGYRLVKPPEAPNSSSLWKKRSDATELTWADGTASGVFVEAVSDSAAEMKIQLRLSEANF